MNYVSFQNEGIIDLRAIKTFGVSVKEKENSIGYFGTGLKYAVAILLRENHEVSVFTGKEEHKFDCKSVEIRGESFNVVTLDGEELGMTLDVGKNWETWMALRELHSNVLDEDGFSQTGYVEPQEGCTTIIVKGDRLRRAYDRINDIFLPDDLLLEKNDAIAVHQRSGQDLYHLGVRAYHLHRPSLFTYDLRVQHELTEDRNIAFSYIADHNIMSGIGWCKDTEFLRRVLTADENTYEGNLPWSQCGTRFGKEFFDVLESLKKEGFKLSAHLRSVYQSNLGNVDEFDEIEPTASQAEIVAKSLKFLKNAGYDVGKYKVKIASDLGAGVLGQAVRKDGGIIWLSHQTVMMGFSTCVGTMFEEYVHLEHKYQDCTRSMQNFLIETVVSLMKEVQNATTDGR